MYLMNLNVRVYLSDAIYMCPNIKHIAFFKQLLVYLFSVYYQIYIVQEHSSSWAADIMGS